MSDASTTPSKKFGGRLLLGSVAAVAIIGLWEGGKEVDGSSVVYADRLAQNTPTVCAGLTRHVTSTPIIIGQRWSAEKCLAEERRAIATVQAQLEKCLTRLPPQSVFDAATSHAWNNGVPNTCSSAAMKSWNAGGWVLGCQRMAKSDSGKRVWSYVKTGRIVGGKPEYRFVQGLANRRDSEVKLCMQDVGK